MTRRRIGPILSLVLLVGLAAVVLVLETRRGDDGDGTAADRAIPFERSDLKAIAIRGKDGALRLEKAGDAWLLTEPLAADSDPDAVEGLLSSMESARIERRLGEDPGPAAYGLAPPGTVLTLELAAGETRVLGVGEGSPIGGGFYALLPDGKEVAVVGASLGDVTRQTALSLRDKRLLDFDPWKIRRLRIERGRDSVLLERPEPGWRLREPIESPADGPTITDLLTALQGLRARTFVSEKPAGADLRRFGLSPPAARMTLLQEGWDVEKSVLFGKATGDGRLARTVGRDPVVTVPGEFWEKVRTGIFDLRRKDILDVSQYRIGSITAAVDGGPALVITRRPEDGWGVSGPVTGAVKSETVDELLRHIANLKAVSFIDHPTGAQRAALSRRPALDLTLQEEAGADGAAGRSQHVIVGPPGPRNTAPARDMAWRAIVIVSGSVPAGIRTALEAVRAEAAQPPPESAPISPPGTGQAPPP